MCRSGLIAQRGGGSRGVQVFVWSSLDLSCRGSPLLNGTTGSRESSC